MWFKNLVIYRLPAEWSIPAAQLEEQLSQRTLQPCGSFDMESRGWVASSVAQRLVHTTNGHHLIALGVEQKLLPGSIIKQVAGERAKLLEEQQGYPVGRRQMRELRERVTEELRARALTRRRVTRAWIDPTNGWFVVDAAGASRAEELVETLRDTLGSLPVQFLETDRSPAVAMAAWLVLGDAPLRFVIDQDLELQSSDQTKATVRYVRHPLEGKEIQQHISGGKYATRLGLTWNDRISFVLTDKLQVKRLEFLEMSKDNTEGESQSEEEQFEVDFMLMSGELTQLLADLSEALGGDISARAQQAA
ncbi:MAG TPA: recombination-associated protein RdgC [Steroidobacteraceae bacterium]|jgi:recombination associated protein RdgC